MSTPSLDRDRAIDSDQEPAGQTGHDDSAVNGAWLNEPLSVVVHLAFAFDIGDEIDLELARQMLQGELGQLPRRRRTPESIGYRPAPIRVPLEPVGDSPAGRDRLGAQPESRADPLRFRRDLAGRAVPLASDALQRSCNWPERWPSRPR